MPTARRAARPRRHDVRININFASRGYLFFKKVYVIFMAALVVGAGVFAAEYHAFQDAASKEAALGRRLATLERAHLEAEKRVEGLKKSIPAGEMRSLAKQADFANAAISTRVFSWTAFLNRLEDIVPDGVGITSVSPDFQSLSIIISGSALSMDLAAEFLDRLTKSPYFEDIPPAFHTTETLADKDIGKTLQVFSLKIKYNPEGRKSAGAPRKEGSS